MATSIVSGDVRPNTMIVDDEGRAFVRANIIPHPQHHSMTHDNLFLIGLCVTLQADNTEEGVGIFENIDTEVEFEFYITQISVSGNVDIYPRFNDRYVSDGQKVIPRNLKPASGLTLPDTRALVYQNANLGNLAINDTDGFYWGPTIFAGARQCVSIDFQGGLILGNGSSISFNAKGTAGDEVCIFAMCSYHAAGTKL